MTSTSLEHMFNQLQLQGMCAVYINTCVRVVFKLGLDPSWLALAALSYVTALVNCYVVDQILPKKNKMMLQLLQCGHLRGATHLCFLPSFATHATVQNCETCHRASCPGLSLLQLQKICQLLKRSGWQR